MKDQRYLSQDDAAILYRLAEHLLRLDGAESEAADELSDIVAGASRVPPGSKRKDIVQLGTVVTLSFFSTGQESSVTLVHPSEANAAAGRISVLTPIGLAIIGRKINACVEVDLPTGRQEKIRIADVRAPEAEAVATGTS
ncbi:nucleoside diphosphate kinase regulator [Oxalicibacterium flavum]|uniref:Nucleoside diphosphate kinase regulator n=1 Tax=Oxalicibacterium flavum TaxID=179467 RepID=A0A8J2UK73_9BURK|nr:GreA/GreB family elongation factor [Oxalicibacterium flavum]GGC01933.1 nucleoside diphosphate kinase regulator [Oxalicibacterium flavum]